MSTQDKPITTPAAMRAAEKILSDWEVVQFSHEPGEGVDDSASAEQLSAIIDQQTHLPELVEAAERLSQIVDWNTRTCGCRPESNLFEKHVCQTHQLLTELRSVLERVKGEK